MVHVSSVKDGTIITFPCSVASYMKVCDKEGVGGVVRLPDGYYISVRDLEAEGLGTKCEIEYPNIYHINAEPYDTEEVEIDDAAIAMRESLGNNWW